MQYAKRGEKMTFLMWVICLVLAPGIVIFALCWDIYDRKRRKKKGGEK